MTARRSRKSTRKKKAPRRKKAPARKARTAAGKRKKAARKKVAARKPARKARKPVRKKKAKAPRTASSVEALARKLVRATQDPNLFSVGELYAEDAISREAVGDPAVGTMALEAKLKTWESMQDSRAGRWKARNVLTRGNTICIEWEADLHMLDGRRVTFREVAVHEVRKGKIVDERYYYDPSSLAPPPAST